MTRGKLLAAALALAVILVSGLAAALSAEEAKKLFQQKGCTSCHNGAVAPDFEGTLKKVEEWAQKYGSLDEAVASEAKSFKMYQNAKTWDQLMSMMPGVTPELKQFFEQVFQQAKGGTAEQQPAGQPATAAAAAQTVTVTQTVVKTVTKTVKQKEIITETVTPPTCDEGTAKLVAKAAYVAAAIVALAAVALAYTFLGRK